MSAGTDLYPWLVADIGGTNARFGLVRGAGAPVADISALRCADHAGPEAAANVYLDQLAALGEPRPQPRLAAFALATPVHGDTIKMTNSAWVISRKAAEAALGVRKLLLFNDFEALALSLPHLTPEEVTLFGGGSLIRSLPMAAIGPGTGLGVALCVPSSKGWLAVAGEGGHVTACAADDFESDVLRVLRQHYDHVSSERVLSGIGLPLLYAAVAQVRGETAESLAPEEITTRALSGADPCCEATLQTFCAMLGTLAGNVALTGGARGGVFVAGGIAQKLGAFFLTSKFRERFEAKGRFRDYQRAIATGLITAPYAALSGAAHGIEYQLDA